MWGNALGWTISFFIVAATAAGIVYVQSTDRPTPPTALVADSQNLDEVELPIDPASLMPQLTGQADATELFRRAAAAYQSDPVTYDRAAEGEIPDDFDTLPAIAPLLDGAMARGTVVLADAIEETVTFKPRARLTALRVLGAGVIRAAMYREKSNPAEAVRLHTAAFALGAKMCDERLVFGEFIGGLDLMGQAASRLQKLERDPARAQQFAAFVDAQRTIIAPRLNPVWQVLGSVDPGVISTHAGDLRVFAKDAKERMFRVEAALALGRTRFSATNPRDRSAAVKLLTELASGAEQDAIVRQAASAAKSMTADDYRQLQ
jgi:hypothetical protein